MHARLFLFRHGEAALPGILAGQRDDPLSAHGRRQALFWQQDLARLRFDRAWSSPLRRAGETAAIILDGNPANTRDIIKAPCLRELSLGAWEGKTSRWIKTHFPQEWSARGENIADVPPPGGESFRSLAARVLPAFADLCREAARHEHTLIAAHQAVNRVILAFLEGIPLQDVLTIPQPTAALTVLELAPDGAVRKIVGRRVPPSLE